MAIIRLFTISTNNIGTQFILKDYPELRLYESYAIRKEIKRLNIEQFFRGIHKDYKQYKKIIYGPVYGDHDPRNGFIYEHDSGELLVVDENDIPNTYETCNTLMCDLSGLFRTDIDIPKCIITSHNEMAALSDKVNNPTIYNDLIRDEWIPNKSFLIIE